jgi:membrane protein
VIAPRDYWTVLKQAVVAWNDDYAPSMGAALAYYTAFSLSPLLIIVIALAGLAFGQETARGQVVAELSGLVGIEGARAVQDLLANASKPASSLLASIIGIGTLIIGATSVFGELQLALDRIWRAPALQQPSGIIALIRSRVLSFGMVIAMGFLLLVSLLIGAGLSAIDHWSTSMIGQGANVLQVLNVTVSFAITVLLFATAYRILPRVKIAWSDVWVGALVTAMLFTLGKYLIGVYIGKAGVSSGFGAAGSLVVILVWVYYSAQIFLLGAEFTWVFAHRHGSKAGTAPEPVPSIPGVR